MRVPKLELRKLTKVFGDTVAVDEVDLVLEAGETVALLGPSGCGKSTTLNMIVGLQEPTQGDILIDGVSVLGMPPGKRGIGLVFQDYAVFTHMTVRKNLAFGLRVRGIEKAEIRKKVEEVAELVQLTDVLDVRARHLGGSQLQRIAIGRTLVTEPSLLLLDEPLSNLEVALRHTMRQQLRQIQERTGQTVIYVTHDQIEALSLAHKIAVMSDGRIRQYDTAHNVYHRSSHTFVGGFMGSPPMNFLTGTVRRNGRLTFDTGDTVLPLDGVHDTDHLADGQEVVLGVRPESLLLAEPDAAVGFPARVQLVQPVGPEQLVSLTVGSNPMKMVIGSETPVREDQELWITGRPDRVAFFDRRSGVRLHGEAALS